MKMQAIALKCSREGCEKFLSSKYNLRRHIESCHNGIRPYQCAICFKKFSSKQNKREHIKLEHSYSKSNAQIPIKNKLKASSEVIEVPNLSYLVQSSGDPDLRPYSKLQRVYMYSDLDQKIQLPEILPAKSQI